MRSSGIMGFMANRVRPDARSVTRVYHIDHGTLAVDEPWAVIVAVPALLIFPAVGVTR